MAEQGPSDPRSFANFDESVSFVGSQLRSEMLDDSFRNVRFVQDQSEELSKLRIDNFNLRLLCHKYEEVFKRGQIENAGLRIYNLEQENMKIRGQLDRASRILSSLRHENEGLKNDNEKLAEKLESSVNEWQRKYDSLFAEFQELKVSERRAESRCEAIENESFRLENVKNSELSTLQQILTSAESKITLLETEIAELRSKGNTSIDRPSGCLDVEDKENVDLNALLDPLSSPLKMSRSSLLRRYGAAQEMLKFLKSNCDSLSVDLSSCRQELSLCESKFRLILKQYDDEKTSHLRDLEQRDELEKNLHDRIADLLRDCSDKDELNEELTGELKQLKEFDARIREEHMRQLNKLHSLLEDRERALLELYVPEATHTPAEESEVVAEVTQYHHDPDSSIFNSNVDVVTGEKAEEQQLKDVTSVEMNKLQHEVALLRSKLVSQVKANTRLKAAFNALSESNPPPPKVDTTNPPANLSISINPSILEEVGDTSQDNESFASLLNSNKKVSQALDKTVNELKSALSKVEAELSASMLEVSQVGEERKQEDVGVGVHDAISASGLNPDRLRDVYSLIKGLVDQFDNLRTFRSSFHETVNRSVLATSVCLDTSSRYAVPGIDVQTSQQASFIESAGENGGPSPLAASANEYEAIEPAVKSIAEKYENDELLSVSHNNTTFHLLREHFNDNTIEDLSMANSLSFTTSQRSHALDITGLEIHSRDIFDRVAHALLEDRERALLELYVPEAYFILLPKKVRWWLRGKAEEQQLKDVTSVEMNKLQHEVALLRSKLVAQVKANTRLKAAFNALSESNPPPPKVATTNPPVNLSISINPSILEEAGNISQGNESFASLHNSNKKVSQTLDRTMNELKSVLNKVEAELSASMLEVSQIGEEPKHEEGGVPTHDTTTASEGKPDRLRDVYSLIKGLINQFDNLCTFRNSFHETVNRSMITNSLCLETSTRCAIPGTGQQTSQQTSFVEPAIGEKGDPSVSEAPASKHDLVEPAAEKGDDEVMSVSQMSHNNTTFHLLREHLNDNTMEDLSMNNSLSFAISQRSHALDITGLEMHSRDIFDRVALAVAGIQEALDAWSLDAATELLAAINLNTDSQRPPISSHIEGAYANSLPMQSLLDLVVRFAELLSKTRYMELLESPAFSGWCDLVHRWFELFIDTLQRHEGTVNLTEINRQLDALEQQFNEEFVTTAAVTQHHQNAALQTSDTTEPPSISLCENGNDTPSSCDQPTLTMDKLKADLSANVKELADKKITVANLESKVQDLMMQLHETVSASRAHESRVKELEAEIPQLETKFRNLELNSQTKEKRAAELEAELSQLQVKLRNLEAQLDETYAMVEVRETNAKELEAEITESRAKLQDMEMQLTEAHLETQTKEVRAQELETEVIESQTKLQKVDTQLTEALSDSRAKEVRVQELEIALKDKELAMANLKEQFAETETRLAQKEARVVELKVAANDLRAIYDDLENQLNNATKDLDEWKAKSERLEDLLAESIERETGTSLKLSSALDEVDSQKEQNVALEAQLKEMLEQHRVNLQSAHFKYKSLLEVADSRFAEMVEQCQLLLTERDNLREELKACTEEKLMLQSDLEMARIVSANAQINLGAFLEDDPICGEKEDLEEIRQKARKYPQLKALAFSLKAKLEKRSTSLHGANKENVRLKVILGENEKRVQGFIQELERLRQQILVKNKVIKKLESAVRETNVERPVSSVDEISTPENPRVASADFQSPCSFNLGTSSFMINGGIFDNHSLPEHLNGVNSLVEDIGATVREISVCVDAAFAECRGERYHDDTSASLADQMSAFSTDTPSSLTVSFTDVPQPSAAHNENKNVPDRLNHLVFKLSTFWSAMTHELQALVNAVQNTATNSGECSCEDHRRARKLVRRSIEALGSLHSRHPANVLISHVLASLNEALELLHRQNSSSSSPAISGDNLSANRTESASSSFHQQQPGEAGATAVNNAFPPPQQADHSSSCSCSCRRRCSRMAASVQELANILNCTASVLAGRTFGRGEVGDDMEQVQEENMMVEGGTTPEDSLDNSLSN
nr:Uveal autoantigen with coiled coil domains [Hymenolepis microstoma]